MYIYESHLGELFASKEELNDDELYCDNCRDYDVLVGCFNNFTQPYLQLKKKFALQFLVPFLCELFPNKVSEKHKGVIRDAKDFMNGYCWVKKGTVSDKVMIGIAQEMIWFELHNENK